MQTQTEVLEELEHLEWVWGGQSVRLVFEAGLEQADGTVVGRLYAVGDRPVLIDADARRDVVVGVAGSFTLPRRRRLKEFIDVYRDAEASRWAV